jgi:uncharacterized protein (DUF433 family)
MTELLHEQPTVVRRSDRGLSIAGTRITLYDIMDYLMEGWPPTAIRDWFKLTDQQIADVMAYIEENRTGFQAEYEQVLRDAEENRRCWEERNRERFAEIAAMPHPPEQAAIRAKLAEHKAKRDRS